MRLGSRDKQLAIQAAQELRHVALLLHIKFISGRKYCRFDQKWSTFRADDACSRRNIYSV